MTPTQLRAFAGVVRLGSVKAAAEELGVTESAISMNLKSLRDELEDPLFQRRGGALAFTPGGLRLATRAVEMLGLQEQTRHEVRHASDGKRMLRLATSSLFAEYCAPGLIELFSSRALDLEVEMSVHPPGGLPELISARGADLAIGPEFGPLPLDVQQQPFLRYELVLVASPRHPLATRTPDPATLASQEWLLGPSAAESTGVSPTLLRRFGVPEQHQRIFQSNEAALAEVRRGNGIGLALGFRVADDLRENKLCRIDGPNMSAPGTWNVIGISPDRLTSAARELLRFITTPRATQAMLTGSGTAVRRFRPSIHVTLWS